MNDLKDNYIIEVLNNIYNQVFAKLAKEQVDIFLCGAASKSSVRDTLRKQFDKEKHLRILYPEDLFMEILNRDKNADLLTLEDMLADNCDLICIVCESPGSLVELGAFTNNKNTVNKVVVVIHAKRRRDKSFIMMGPVKVIKKIDNRNVVFYKEDKISVLHDNLNKVFKKTHRKKVDNRDINTIIGMHYYIMLILYFFGTIKSKQLINYLKYVFHNKGYMNFDSIYVPSINYLYKQKYIQQLTRESEKFNVLTRNGYYYIENVMNNLKISGKTRLYDSIRFAIMEKIYYKQRHSS